MQQILIDTILTQYSKLTATETKFFDNKGVVIEEREVLAHDVNLTAARDLQRFLGAIATREDDGSTAAVSAPITINLAFLGPERAAAVLEAARKSELERDPGQPVLDAERDPNQG